MGKLITKKDIIENITRSVNNPAYFDDFRNFVLIFYSGDSDYIFESQDVENFFTVISSYFETETFDKRDRNVFLVHLRDALLKNSLWSEELLIAVRNWEDIKDVIEKYGKNLITGEALNKFVKKYCFPRNNVEKIINFVKMIK